LEIESHLRFLPLPPIRHINHKAKGAKVAMVANKITNGDIKLLSWIAEYKFLTIKQLGALSQRSLQVIRRRQRFLESGNFVDSRDLTFVEGPGRAEKILIITENGLKFLKDKDVLSGHAKYFTNATKDFLFVNHDLLVNWFFIHLIHIGKVNPRLSTQHLTVSSHQLKKNSSEKPLPMEHFFGEQSHENYSMIPDGVFIITDKQQNKSLLFFLEVDMGTETLVSSKGKPATVRLKIINYQALFGNGHYKRYEKIFNVCLNGFRLLFLSHTPARLNALCRLVREMPPSDFVWLADQNQMFSHGIGAEIWVRGGKVDQKMQSILGDKLACEITITDKIR